MDKDGRSINRPPILDGSNYDYWKARMVAFLKSMDNRACKAVVKGWTHPISTSKDGTTSLNGEADWSEAEEQKLLAILKLSTPYSMVVIEICSN
jgi:hypothetical protein